MLSKMAIISLSFPDQMIKEMDQIQKSGGFAGRSELVRSAIRLLLEDTKEKNALLGHTNAIIVVTHDESNEAPITKLKQPNQLRRALPPGRRRKESWVNGARIPEGRQIEECQARRDRVNVDSWMLVYGSEALGFCLGIARLFNSSRLMAPSTRF